MESNMMIELIERYLDGTATPEEMSIVDLWYDSMDSNEGLMDNLEPEVLASIEEKSFTNLIMLMKNYPAD